MQITISKKRKKKKKKRLETNTATSSHKSARRQGGLEELDAHLMAHKESPSTMNFLIPNLSASRRPVRRAIILASFTVLKPERTKKEISLTRQHYL